MKYIKPILITFTIFITLWSCLLLITINKHIRRQPNTYDSEIFADKAGYYVYLPATFIYNWNGQEMPDSIDKKTGRGFDIINNYITTKYPMGVAIMMSPFWLINHYFIAQPNDGFSFSYTLTSCVSSTFYVLLGLFISYACFKKYASPITSLLITISILLSTNLFYYTVIETGMSHSFSFFWFTLLLFMTLKIKDQNKITYKDAFILGICIGFILLLRPINIVFCFPYVLILLINNPNKKQMVKDLLFSKKSLLLYLLTGLLFLPQLFYYSYISTISPAYGGTGFPYLTNPRILEVLFAPNNGMFLYTPILFFIFCTLFIYKKNIPFVVPICILFGSIVYLYGSWQNYELGCSFGHRSVVEFYTLLFLPLTSIKISERMKKIFIFIVILSSLYTLKIAFSYDGCFYGNNDWDWNAYLTLLISNIK